MKNNFISAIDKQNLKSNLIVGKVYEIYNELVSTSGAQIKNSKFPFSIKNGKILTLINLNYEKSDKYQILIKFEFLVDNKIVYVKYCEVDTHFTFKEII